MSEASLFLVYRVVSASRLWLDVSSALGAVASSEIYAMYDNITNRIDDEFHEEYVTVCRATGNGRS